MLVPRAAAPTAGWPAYVSPRFRAESASTRFDAWLKTGSRFRPVCHTRDGVPVNGICVSTKAPILWVSFFGPARVSRFQSPKPLKTLSTAVMLAGVSVWEKIVFAPVLAPSAQISASCALRDDALWV